MLKRRQTHVKKPLYVESEKISEAFDKLLSYIIRDFVNSWYSNISRSPVFLNEVDGVLRAALGNLRDRMIELDLVEIVISRFVPILTNHIRDFHVAEVIVRGRKLNRSMTETDELDIAIASKFRDGELHPAASLSFPDVKMIQQDYLQDALDDQIPANLPQWEEADRLDLQQMDQAYLSRPELKVTHPYHDDDEPMDAAPGDLGLAEAIAALTKDIDKLIAQSAIIESLTKKAELTNNTAELRILRKSKASLSRELRRKELQRQHYIIQESDNNLYGRAEIRISSTTTSKDEEGREFVMYVVEVQKDAGEQVPAAKWEVIRRYSEFHELHQKLRARYPSVRSLDFPGRRVVMKFHADFLRKRQLALEKYLRDLLLLPEVCHSRELRSFLSQSTIGPSTYPGSNPVQGGDKEKGDRKGMITRLYDSVTDGVEDILGNIPVLDQLSLAGHNLIAAATNQRGTGVLAHEEDGTIAAEAEAEINAFENKDIEPFIKPICDIFLEVFELNRGNNWLRGRATHFARMAGEITDIKLMNGFGFIEYKDPMDARDVVPEAALDLVELLIACKSVDFLKDLKDFARHSGLDVIYSEVEQDGPGQGFVEFETDADLRNAIEKLSSKEFRGKEVTCVADPQPDIPMTSRDFRAIMVLVLVLSTILTAVAHLHLEAIARVETDTEIISATAALRVAITTMTAAQVTGPHTDVRQWTTMIADPMMIHIVEIMLLPQIHMAGPPFTIAHLAIIHPVRADTFLEMPTPRVITIEEVVIGSACLFHI
ncbi:Sorting nexin-12 [Ceratocystis platani]|uniref:Sorting nexin-12 n=1 Tax=Ceratocystis fimbriata f. sp. platani TaxID=88771 RepID=A0A0F8B5A3_CERFI|nr:Sorting nexin-12 [Ceratocystis platani]